MNSSSFLETVVALLYKKGNRRLPGYCCWWCHQCCLYRSWFVPRILQTKIKIKLLKSGVCFLCNCCRWFLLAICEEAFKNDKKKRGKKKVAIKKLEKMYSSQCVWRYVCKQLYNICCRPTVFDSIWCWIFGWNDYWVQGIVRKVYRWDYIKSNKDIVASRLS